MQLFSENGFRGTSITAIEAAAGLSPGAGGIYHHFRSKQELLRAGVERHLARLNALRDIKAALSGVLDLRSELTMTARYALAEFDREQELVRVLAAEARAHPELLGDAAEQLVHATFAGFTEWLSQDAGVPPERAATVSALGLGALLSTRLLHTLGLAHRPDIDDETVVAMWVDLMLNLIEDAPRQA